MVITGEQILSKQVDANHVRATSGHFHTRDAFSHLPFVDRRGDSWLEVANLWGVIVGRPGSLKSPAMSEALA